MKTDPCNLKKIFEECCECYLAGMAPPSTAEALICSQYPAYIQRDHIYFLRIWHESSLLPSSAAIKFDIGACRGE